MQRLICQRVVAGPVVTLVLLCATGSAQAEPTADEKALATVLFREGRTLMSAGRTQEACLKLEESQRLDPSGGTLLNLALCHEQEGRLARSWSEFNEAIVLARRDGRRDREVAAADHARALQPRLSKLFITVPVGAQVEGLRIERDGREVGPGAWSTPIPLDGGEHTVRATAPGKESFAKTVVIGKEFDEQTIEIPVLVTPVMVVGSPSVSHAPPAHALAPEPDSPLDRGPARVDARRIVGWTFGAAGLVQLGLVGYFGMRAFDKHRLSDNECPNNRCTPLGASLNNQARGAADTATVLTITGIGTVATGIYFLVASRKDSTQSPESGLTLDVSGRGPTLTLHGRF